MSHSSLETTETPHFHRKHPPPNNNGHQRRLPPSGDDHRLRDSLLLRSHHHRCFRMGKSNQRRKEKKTNIPPLKHFLKSTTFRIETPSFTQRLTPLTLVPRRTRQLLQHRLSNPRRSNPHLLRNLHPRNLLHSRDIPRLHRSSPRRSPHRTHDGRSNHQSLGDRLGQLRRFR